MSMYRHLIPLIFGAVALTSACTSGGGYGAVYATSSGADLVYVSPGVYAVANYSEPVFYADNFYWRYYDGLWYRSPRYTGGWRRFDRPPAVVRRIDRPYTRYYRDGGRIRSIEVRDRARRPRVERPRPGSERRDIRIERRDRP